MGLKIIRAADPVEVPAITVTVYAAPGLGKTTLGFAASKPLLIDFDRGAYRGANRKDYVQVDSWNDIANITADDLADYDTVVVDTAGRALDVLAADIIAQNPKMGRGGALTLQGFGQLKAQFTAWVKLVRSFGKDLILLAHATEDKSGDDIVERLDMQGASKNEVYKVSDAMGRMTIRNRKRVLEFRPTDTSFGKDPAALGEIPVPDVTENPDFMGEIIQQIKDKLNEHTEAQREAIKAVQDWQAAIADASTAEDINGFIPEIKALDSDWLKAKVKPILHNRATELGLVSDRKAGGYVEKEQPEPDEVDGGDGDGAANS